VIAIDANLLVYAHVMSYAQHEAARAWLEQQLVRAPRVGRFAGLEWFNPLQPA
jgi:hypothetical protein